MRSRASALMLAPLVALRTGARGGSRRRASATSRRTRSTVDRRARPPTCSEIGYDMRRPGYDNVRQLAARSSSSSPDAQAGRRRSRPTASTSRRCAIEAPRAKSKALGDSPNPFFNV